MPTLIGTKRKTFDPNDVFMATQKKIIFDPSRVILFEKTRRGGGTWAWAYRSVRRGAMMATPQAPKSWFSSSDDSNAAEYIDYCTWWARQVNVKAQLIDQCLYDAESDLTSRALKLANGYEIHALTSSFRQFRGKGGDGILDEFAHHDNPVQMWKAFNALKVWGGTLGILSTHNGPNSLFNRFLIEARAGKRKGWSVHKLTIQQAIQEGIVDRILRRKATKKEEADFLEECRTDCFDEETFQQEFCCIPIDESSAFLPYEILHSCERPGLLVDDLRTCKGPLYLGMDIGRHKHLSVIFVLEDTGPMLVHRKIIPLEKMPFHEQKSVLYPLLRLPNMRRASLDATGLGEQMAEEAVREFGTYKVESVKFSAPLKDSLAHGFKRQFEDETILIDSNYELREDLHSVRKIVSQAGVTRFDVNTPERLGHADRFWAAALAVSAARGRDNSSPAIASSGRSGGYSERLLRVGYADEEMREGRYAGF